jgi:RNA polymerase sigma factor (sigma-70 family)
MERRCVNRWGRENRSECPPFVSDKEKPVAQPTTGARKGKGLPPYHVSHPSFEQLDAEQVYGFAEGEKDFTTAHMPDEVTRDYARRMHYAAWRANRAKQAAEQERWQRAWLHFRDAIVVGNRKLIYRAVRRWMPPASYAEDMAGDCHVVLIQAVTAYNPWLGIRFSTYAFTCLMRALSRLSQRQASDRLAKSLPLEALPDGEPRDLHSIAEPATRLARIDEFLREGHELLSKREKRVLMRRFSLDDQTRSGTLEQVGRELGLSKERVRQVQASALSKLRAVLVEAGPTA